MKYCYPDFRGDQQKEVQMITVQTRTELPTTGDETPAPNAVAYVTDESTHYILQDDGTWQHTGMGLSDQIRDLANTQQSPIDGQKLTMLATKTERILFRVFEAKRDGPAGEELWQTVDDIIEDRA